MLGCFLVRPGGQSETNLTVDGHEVVIGFWESRCSFSIPSTDNTFPNDASGIEKRHSCHNQSTVSSLNKLQSFFWAVKYERIQWPTMNTSIEAAVPYVSIV